MAQLFTFNSLYEIPVTVFPRLRRVAGSPFNSLYEILLDGACSFLFHLQTFNSLYEIPEKVFEKKLSIKITFNSLYEIPLSQYGYVLQLGLMSFNSLYEIRVLDDVDLIIITPIFFQFSL